MDVEIADLGRRVIDARRAHDSILAAWQAKQAQRHALAVTMMANVASQPSTAGPSVSAPATSSITSGGGAAPAPTGPAPWPGAHQRVTPDASPRTVQNLLFVLGGVLLGIGAIVFTAVAWNRYGVTGRELILTIATLLTFAIPAVAQRRSLPATAETFAAIALLLLALDGSGAWRLGLFHLVRHMSASTYAGLVCALVAMVGAGYGTALRLTGPRVVALVSAQAVVPLLVAVHRPGVAGWGATFAVVVAMNIGVTMLVLKPDTARTALRVVAWAFGLGWLAVATFTGLAAPLQAASAGSLLPPAGALGLVALVTLLVGTRTSERLLRAIPVAAASLEVGVVTMHLAVRGLHIQPLVALAGLTLLLAAAAWAIRRSWWISLGVTAAARAATGLLAIVALGPLCAAAIVRLTRVAPTWHADLTALTQPVFTEHGQSTAIIALFAAAALLIPRTHRVWLLLAGAVPLLISYQAAPRLAWWAAPALDASLAVPLLVVTVLAIRRGWAAGTLVSAIGAGILALHASLAGLARPVTTAAALGGIVVVGITSMLALRLAATDGTARRIVGGLGFGAALLALPGAVAAGTVVITPGPIQPMRYAMGAVAVGLVSLALVRRWTGLRWYGVGPVLASATIVALVPLGVNSSERVDLYALVGLLIVALVPMVAGSGRGEAVGVLASGAILAVTALLRVTPIVLTVLALPYTWLDKVWPALPSPGRPVGVGLSPFSWPLDGLDVLAMVLVTAIASVVGHIVAGGRAALVAGLRPAAMTVLVALAAAGASWPTVPVVTLALGASAVLFATCKQRGTAGWVNGVTGLVTIGAGAVALTPTTVGAICALGGLVLVASVVGTAGTTITARASGWLGAVVSGETLVVVSSRSAGAGLGVVAVGMLAAAAVTLIASAIMTSAGRAAAETRVLAAAAHASAFVAWVIVDSVPHAAVIAAGWGVVIGVRALWPGLTVRSRRVQVSVAAALELIAWWLLAASRHVHVVDAYTLPLAVVALLAGWLAARNQPGLRSWVAYGPALMAGFIPSLVPVLHGDASVTRRLLIGAVALVVVVLGARVRMQAPVIIAGVTLVVLALHEIVLVWRLLPTWLPLTAAGLVVIGVAITYERRRRDFVRLRGAVGRMA